MTPFKGFSHWLGAVCAVPVSEMSMLLRDVLLGQSDLAGAAAIYVDLQGGIRDLLVDVNIDRAGDGGDLLLQVLGESDSCSCRGR